MSCVKIASRGRASDDSRNFYLMSTLDAHFQTHIVVTTSSLTHPYDVSRVSPLLRDALLAHLLGLENAARIVRMRENMRALHLVRLQLSADHATKSGCVSKHTPPALLARDRLQRDALVEAELVARRW